jgi:hypothetical protein
MKKTYWLGAEKIDEKLSLERNGNMKVGEISFELKRRGERKERMYNKKRRKLQENWTVDLHDWAGDFWMVQKKNMKLSNWKILNKVANIYFLSDSVILQGIYMSLPGVCVYIYIYILIFFNLVGFFHLLNRCGGYFEVFTSFRMFNI